jgi:hypothetical protein
MNNNKIEITPRDLLLLHLAEQREIEFSLDDLKTDANAVSKKLLGQMANADDLRTVESIVRVVSKLPNYNKLVEGIKDKIDLPDPESFVIGSIAWFRKMMGISG